MPPYVGLLSYIRGLLVYCPVFLVRFTLQGLFYICEYFGITPQQFFDDGNAYPAQISDLVADMKKLDAASLEHLAAIVKEMAGNK